MDEFVALRHGNNGRPTKPSISGSGTSIQSHMDRNNARTNKKLSHRLSSGDRSATSATQSVSSSGSESTGSIPKLKASKLDSASAITSRTSRRRASKNEIEQEPNLEEGLEDPVPPPPPLLQRTSTTGIRERRSLRRNISGSGLPTANSIGDGRTPRRNRSGGIGMMGASSRRADSTTESPNRRTPRRLRRCATANDQLKHRSQEEETEAPTTESETAPERRRRLRRTQTQEAALEGTRRSGRACRSQRRAATPRDGSTARLRRTRSTDHMSSSAARDKMGSSRRDARGGTRRTSTDTADDKEDPIKQRMLKYSAKARDCSKQAARPERRMSNTPAA